MKTTTLQNQSYKALLIAFKEWLDILGYSKSMRKNYPRYVKEFLYYLEQKHITNLDAITTNTITHYYNHLKIRPNKNQNSGSLENASLNQHQQALKKWNTWLSHHGRQPLPLYFKYEPKDSYEVSQHILTPSEIKHLFKTTEANRSYKFGLRHKATLVLLYSCGLRVGEACSLNRKDVWFDKQLIHVRKGKYYKERLVPINLYNLDILEDYLYDARPHFFPLRENAEGKEDSEAFLINQYGKRLNPQDFSRALDRIVKDSGLDTLKEKRITPHLLRHSIATHLLQQDAQLEDIQQFLGHSTLESTQLYTHIISKIKQL